MRHQVANPRTPVQSSARRTRDGLDWTRIGSPSIQIHAGASPHPQGEQARKKKNGPGGRHGRGDQIATAARRLLRMRRQDAAVRAPRRGGVGVPAVGARAAPVGGEAAVALWREDLRARRRPRRFARGRAAVALERAGHVVEAGDLLERLALVFRHAERVAAERVRVRARVDDPFAW